MTASLGPFITIDAVNAIIKESAPACFHCGLLYVKDMKYCTPMLNTWKPDCECVRRTIRVTTGGPVVFNSYELKIEDDENDC